MTPDSIMIFAAGHGTRMRELTHYRPKPLVPVAGVAMIDRALNLVDQAGIKNRVVNIHYLGDMLKAHLLGRDHLTVVEEPREALETGGGLRHALPFLGSAPVFTMNPDAIWTGKNPLTQLAQKWRPREMDALLLLSPISKAIGHVLGGDFTSDARYRLWRAEKNNGASYVYTGAQILRTDGLAEVPFEKFSLNLLWDQMIERGRLFGCVHDGDWISVGTPEAVKLAEGHLSKTSNV